MDFYKGTIPIIDTDTPRGMDLAFPRVGEGYGMSGRDWNEFPATVADAPSGMQVIPQSEWDARFDEQEAQQSSLEHLYLRGPGGGPVFENLDQNGHGYCWMYSNGHALMMCRLRDNLPLVRLNPHSSAALRKNGQDQGGWCGEGASFIRDNGMATEQDWPGHSRDVRRATAEVRERMKRFRQVEEWYDLTKPLYGQVLTPQMIATCGFQNIPCPQDFNWWGHSVCGIRWVRIERGSWGPLIINSWKGWGRHGLGVLRGSQATANNAVAYRTVTAVA